MWSSLELARKPVNSRVVGVYGDMKTLTLAALFIFSVFVQGCLCAPVEDEDDYGVIHQQSLGVRLPQCEMAPKDETPLPNVCEGQISIHPNTLDKEHLTALGSAMETWNEMLSQEYFHLEITDENRAACQVVVGARPEKILATWKATQNMVVDMEKLDSFSLEKFQVVMQHELGHSIGMRHRPDGVMCSNVWPISQFNETDREQCEQLGLCS